MRGNALSNMDGFIPLSDDDLKSGNGARQLNTMLQKLFNTAAGDGTTISDFTGYGSPEGVLTAGIGATYRRVDGGGGTSFYIKSSGSGNTGWTSVNIVTYPLSVANGGTGGDFSATAQGTVPYFSATGVISGLAPGTLGYVYTTQGAGANPIWAPVSTGSQFFSGSGTFTAPTGITMVFITMVGGGGGGGKNAGGGGGGGGGESVIDYPFTVTPGNNYIVTIGALGAGATVANGGTGGNTSFDTLQVNGGAGATGLTHGAGGSQAATTRSRVLNGKDGIDSNAGNSDGYDGGGSAFGVGGGQQTTGNANGNPGTGFGAGGSGGNGNGNGGAGTAGFVLVEY